MEAASAPRVLSAMTRRRAKVLAFTGAVLTAVIGAVYGASTWWYATWFGNIGDRTLMLHISQGTARGELYPGTLPPNMTGFNLYTHLGAHYGTYRNRLFFETMPGGSGSVYTVS